MLRRLSLPAHGAVELSLGPALIAAPFALGLGPAGLVACLSAGALVHLAGSTAHNPAQSGPRLAVPGIRELALGACTRWTRRA